MLSIEWKKAGTRCAMVVALILMTGCAQMGGAGSLDAGCLSYGEARLAMPSEPVPAGAWGGWIADTDDRMTGTCR